MVDCQNNAFDDELSSNQEKRRRHPIALQDIITPRVSPSRRRNKVLSTGAKRQSSCAKNQPTPTQASLRGSTPQCQSQSTRAKSQSTLTPKASPHKSTLEFQSQPTLTHEASPRRSKQFQSQPTAEAKELLSASPKEEAKVEKKKPLRQPSGNGRVKIGKRMKKQAEKVLNKSRNPMISSDEINQQKVKPFGNNDSGMTLEIPFQFIGCEFKTIQIPQTDSRENWLDQFAEDFADTTLQSNDEKLMRVKQLRDQLMKVYSKLPQCARDRIGKFSHVTSTSKMTMFRDRLRKKLNTMRTRPKAVKRPRPPKQGVDYGNASLTIPEADQQIHQRGEEILNSLTKDQKDGIQSMYKAREKQFNEIHQNYNAMVNDMQQKKAIDQMMDNLFKSRQWLVEQSELAVDVRLTNLKASVDKFIVIAVSEGRSKKTGKRMKGFINMWLWFVEDASQFQVNTVSLNQYATWCSVRWYAVPTINRSVKEVIRFATYTMVTLGVVSAKNLLIDSRKFNNTLKAMTKIMSENNRSAIHADVRASVASIGSQLDDCHERLIGLLPRKNGKHVKDAVFIKYKKLVRDLIIVLMADVVFTIACRPIEAVYIVVTWRKVSAEQKVRGNVCSGPGRMIQYNATTKYWGLRIPPEFSKTLTQSTWGVSSSDPHRHRDLSNTNLLWGRIDAFHRQLQQVQKKKLQVDLHVVSFNGDCKDQAVRWYEKSRRYLSLRMLTLKIHPNIKLAGEERGFEPFKSHRKYAATQAFNSVLRKAFTDSGGRKDLNNTPKVQMSNYVMREEISPPVHLLSDEDADTLTHHSDQSPQLSKQVIRSATELVSKTKVPIKPPNVGSSMPVEDSEDELHDDSDDDEIMNKGTQVRQKQ